MQKVTYSQLESLMQAGEAVNESDSAISYQDFVKTYRETLKRQAKRWFRRSEAEEATYKEMRDGWIKDRCPPVMYISEGSSRAAFAIAGGKCLKVAINKKGISQNEVEFKNATEAVSEYSCFAQNFDADKSSWGSIVVECCTDLDDAKLAKLYADCSESGKMKYSFGSTFKILTRCLLETLKDHRFDTGATMREIVQNEKKAKSVRSRYYEDAWQFCRIFLRRVADQYWQKFPQYKVFADLIRFYQKHGGSESAMCIDDLSAMDNWGMAIRDGKIVAVILDPGLSEDVFNKHYAKQK